MGSWLMDVWMHGWMRDAGDECWLIKDDIDGCNRFAFLDFTIDDHDDELTCNSEERVIDLIIW